MRQHTTKEAVTLVRGIMNLVHVEKPAEHDDIHFHVLWTGKSWCVMHSKGLEVLTAQQRERGEILVEKINAAMRAGEIPA